MPLWRSRAKSPIVKNAAGSGAASASGVQKSSGSVAGPPAASRSAKAKNSPTSDAHAAKTHHVAVERSATRHSLRKRTRVGEGTATGLKG